MSKNVTALEQGKLQGANTSIMAMANIIGPALFAFTFAATIDPGLATKLPGTAFWLAGGVLFFAAIVTFLVTRSRRTTA